MCGTITTYFDLRDTIKEQVNIGNYLNTYYPELNLKSVGKRRLGKCPFRSEKDPSFNVYTDSNKYYCYGCNEKGDLIQFVSKYENISFNDACKKIADNEGISYQLTPPNKKHEEYKDSMNLCCNKYENNLLGNKDALSYITNRGISLETIQKFRLGLVPDNERQYRQHCVYDMEGRISFPFLEYGKDNSTRCVGMAYRTLIKDRKPKYINDSNHSDSNDELNRVFNKGNFLFGYNQAQESIKRVGCAIIVEGYFDVLALHESKITNVVGICGTAFTERQADLLKKLTKDLFIFLDGDKAGFEAMHRVLPMLLEKGFNVKFVKAENCADDPASICKDLEFNTLKIRNYISKNSSIAVLDIIDDKVKYLSKIITNQQVAILDEMEGIFSKMTDKNSKLVYEEYLYKRIGLR